MISGAKQFVHSLVKGITSNNSVIFVKFGSLVQEKMLFKDISYLELWRPFCSVERNHLCKLGRGFNEDQLSDIILNFDQ